MSKISDYPIGTKVIFVENYPPYFKKGEITEITGNSYFDFMTTRVHKVLFEGQHITCYGHRIKPVVYNNPLNRILYPELKPDGEGYLL
jgi:hypothetical protein